MCLIPIWNFASNPLLIFLAVNSGHDSTTQKTDGTCNSEHCGARASYTHRTRAYHSSFRSAHAGSTCLRDLGPARARGGTGSSARLPVAKRRGFHKPDREFLAPFPPLVRFGICEFPLIMSDPETEGLRSTFSSYMAEGERLYLCGEFAKAAHSFSNVSRALNLSITDHRFGLLITPRS